MGDVKIVDPCKLTDDVVYGLQHSRQIFSYSGLRAGEKDYQSIKEIADVQGGIATIFDKYENKIKEKLRGTSVFHDVTSMLEQNRMSWERWDVTYAGYGISFNPSDSSSDLIYSIEMLDNNSDGMVDCMTVYENVRYHYFERQGLFRKEEYDYYVEYPLYHLSGNDFQVFFSALLAAGLEQ